MKINKPSLELQIEFICFCYGLVKVGGEVSKIDKSVCANPELMKQLANALVNKDKLMPRLLFTQSLDIKSAIRAAVNQHYSVSAEITPEIKACLTLLNSFIEEPKNWFPSETLQTWEQTRLRLLEQTTAILPHVDFSEELFALTGSKISFQPVATPILMLPVTYSGRYGATVKQSAGFISHLAFGYAVDEAPEKQGTDLHFVEQGARHFIVAEYLNLHWPALANNLNKFTALKSMVTEVMEQPPEKEIWPFVVRLHLQSAIKLALTTPEFGFNTIPYQVAGRTGLFLLPWCVDWIQRHVGNIPFHQLPKDMEEQVSDWHNQINMIKGIQKLKEGT